MMAVVQTAGQRLFRRMLLSEGASGEEADVEMEMYGSSETEIMVEEVMGSGHAEEHEEHAEDGTNSTRILLVFVKCAVWLKSNNQNAAFSNSCMRMRTCPSHHMSMRT